MRKLSFVLVLVLVVFTSCNYFGGERISGNGNVITRDQKVGSFTHLDVRGNVVVRIKQDNATGVQIETDENLLEYLDVFTEGNTLVIQTRDGFNLRPSKDIIAHVSAPAYQGIEVSGACELISEGVITGSKKLEIHASGSSDIDLDVNFANLTTNVSGSSHLVLKGFVTDFSASLSGSSDIRGFDLVADNIQLDMSGASDVEVTVNKKLDIDASGSSNVTYKGNAQVSQNISGSGSVKKIS